LAASDIKTDGNPTRVALDPVALDANREYALVVLTDDANHAVSVAELGKYDPRTGWVTAQPYQIGVLLSSSNGITWTPHQSQDLTFRLLACHFTQTQKTVNLGQYTVTNLSDVMMLAGVERPQRDGCAVPGDRCAGSNLHLVRGSRLGFGRETLGQPGGVSTTDRQRMGQSHPLSG